MKTNAPKTLPRLALAVAVAVAAAATPSAFAAFENRDTDPTPALHIRIHNINPIRGNEIQLGEIADINTSDSLQRARLQQIVIGRSPAMGYRQRMHPNQIRAILRTLGLDETNAIIDLPETIFIEREVQKIDTKKLAEAIQNEVLAKLPQASGEPIVEEIALRDEIVVNAGSLTWTIDVRIPRNGIGSASYMVDLLVDGKNERRIAGAMNIDRETQVLETTQAIRRGEPLDPKHCRTVTRRISEVRAQPLTPHDLEGPLEIKQDLKPGETLTWNNVERRLLVKRGQAVRMTLQSDNGIRITTVGQARNDGALGDLIEVVNITSGKSIQAIVAGNRLVSVPF